VAQCRGVDTGLTAQCRIVVGTASPGGLVEQHRDMIPRRVRGTAWRGFVFDLGACMCQNIKCPSRGSRRGGGEPMRASSEAEPHPRGRPALERGGTLLEGASGPRARRSLVSAVLCPSSESEFRPRVAGADRSGGPLGPWAPAAGSWSFRVCFIVVSSLVFYFLRKKVGFSRLFRGPLWLSPIAG
jgi:hypothetical protein